MIDLSKERLIPLKCARQAGISQSLNTLKRWQDVGLMSHINGETHFLDKAYDGGRRCTTREAYIRFLTAYNAPPKPAKTKKRKARR